MFRNGKASTASDMVSAKLLDYGYVYLDVDMKYFKSDRLRELANWMNSLADALDKQPVHITETEMNEHN